MRILLLAFLLISVFSLKAQPVIPTPLQEDEIIIDAVPLGYADPNDRIRYIVTIQNTGNAPATNVQVMASIDPNTTFVAGSFKTSPLAVNDAFNATGNVGLNVPVANGLMANDYDDNIPGLTITAGTFATTQGGSIMINADGSFMYTPPAGFTGSDTYTYTLNDGNGVGGGVPATDPGTVTFTVANLIWFVDNTGGGSGGDGRLNTPFKTLANFNSGSANAGAVIYIEHTGSDYDGGIVLQDGERLFGEGHTGTAAPMENLTAALPFMMPPFSKTLPNIDGTRPVVMNTGGIGDAIRVAMNNTIRGLNVGNTLDFGIDAGGSGVGALTISELNITTTGGGFRTDNTGTLAVSIGSLSSTGGTNAINLGSTTGTFTVTGAVTASGNTSDALVFVSTTTVVSLGATTSTASGANQALQITNNTGAISFAAGSAFSGSTAEEILIHQGTGNITLNGSVTGTAGGTIKITGRTGGTIDFTGVISHNAAAAGIVIGTSTAGENNSGGTINFSNASKTVNSSTANAIDLTNNNGVTINFTNGGLNVDATSGTAFRVVGGGTVNVSGAGNTIDATSGTAFLNSGTGGSAAIDINANITNTTGELIDIQNRTANANVALSGNLSNSGTGMIVNGNTMGTILFSGASKSFTTTTNNAIDLTSNTGATINFTNGGLVINTTSGVGFNATGGGTISVTGSGNTINAATGPANTNTNTALNVNATTIGAGNLNFQSIYSGNNTAAADPANGIVLNNTGAGGLMVTGDAGGTNNGSGGTIQFTTGNGINFLSTSNVSIGYMNINNSGDEGMLVQNSTNLTINRCNLTNNGNSTSDDGIQIGNTTGTSINGVTGTLTITNTVISGSAHNHVHIRNVSGTLSNMNITNSSFNNLNDTNGANAFLFEASNTAIVTAATMTSCTISNNSPQRGLEVQAHDNANIQSYTVQTSNFNENGIHMSFTQDGASSSYFKVLNNTNMLNANPLQAINVFSSATSTGGVFQGRIEGNIIGDNAITSSGSTAGGGIRMFLQGQTRGIFIINNNQIYETPQSRGIEVTSGAYAGNGVDATITNNTIDHIHTGIGGGADFPLAGIYMVADNTTGSGNGTLRADVRGNNVNMPGGSWDYPTFDGTAPWLYYYEEPGLGTSLLLDNPPTPAPSAAAELAATNTGSTGASSAVGLITGSIQTPP